MAEVVLEQLRLRYPGTDDDAVRGIDLVIPDKKYVVLLGPSGCGKTSTLRMIAGLERPTQGNVIIDEETVNTIYPGNRNVAMVFQSYALYPHKKVRDNLASCLKKRISDQHEIEERIKSVASKLSIEDILEHYPRELSVGEQQRVALARALIRRPKVFLLDEPLSNLDTTLKSEMRTFLKQLHQEQQITSIHVTHDQLEAQALADIVIIMENGLIQQIGTPQEVYQNPVNQFVAGFIGSPTMNFIEGKFREPENFEVFPDSLSTPESLPISAELAHKIKQVLDSTDRKIILGVRPEHFVIMGREVESSFPLTLLVLEHRGNEVVMNFELDSNILRIKKDKDQLGFTPKAREIYHLQFPETYTYLFDYETKQRIFLD